MSAIEKAAVTRIENQIEKPTELFKTYDCVRAADAIAPVKKQDFIYPSYKDLCF